MDDAAIEGNPETIRREKIYDEHALRIGQANMAWNDVHTEVFSLFRLMSKMEWAAADAVFFSIRTDSAQRDMTSALARHYFASKPDDLAEILRLLNKLGTLAAERNAAIHTAWIVRPGIDLPKPFLRRQPPKALQEDATNQFLKLSQTLTTIYVEFAVLRERLWPSPSTAPLTTMDLMPNHQGNAFLPEPPNSPPPPQP